MPLTNGFADAISRQDHFKRHGGGFGATTAKEYEALADAFLGSPLASSILECVRLSNADIVRYNPITDEFGILSAQRIIKTYFKPMPWNKRKYPNNVEYWKEQCKK